MSDMRMLITCSASLAMWGCTGTPAKLYPSDWPRLIRSESHDCDALDGQFINKAARTTAFQSSSHPGVTDAYLSGLLEHGMEGSTSERQVGVSKVAIHIGDGGLLSIELDGRLQPTDFGVGWSCNQSNGLKGTFSSEAEGEDLMFGRRTIHLEAYRVMDGSLAVHQVLDACGVYFGVVPGCEGTEDWFLFRKAE